MGSGRVEANVRGSTPQYPDYPMSAPDPHLTPMGHTLRHVGKTIPPPMGHCPLHVGETTRPLWGTTHCMSLPMLQRTKQAKYVSAH